jgi:hypothetical protein
MIAIKRENQYAVRSVPDIINLSPMRLLYSDIKGTQPYDPEYRNSAAKFLTDCVNIWSLCNGASAISLIHKCMEMDASGQVTLINSVCPCRSVICVTYDSVTHTIRYVILLPTYLCDRVSRLATLNGPF